MRFPGTDMCDGKEALVMLYPQMEYIRKKCSRSRSW